MKWEGKKVLITGASGFIGSHLTEKLVSLNAEVSCFTRYNSMNRWGWIDTFPNQTKEKIKIIPGDLKDSDAVLNAVKGKDIVFHLGALIAIPYSYINPGDFVQSNILGTYNILSAAKFHNAEKVIHTSTSEVYGSAKYVPIDENHPLQAQSPYSASKIAADKLAESFYNSFEMPITTIRPFNTFGPRQSARAIIPTIITQALTKDKIFIGSLFPKRDFTFVDDTVNGFLKVAENKSVGQTFNIGSGTEISIGDLAKKIIQLTGKVVQVMEQDERKRPENSEVDRLLANTDKAKKILNWQPEFNLDEGLKITISWISKNMPEYKTGIYNI